MEVKSVLLFFGLASVAFCVLVLQKKNALIWLPGYCYHLLTRPRTNSTKHVLFCFADHYEPRWNHPSIEVERQRVDRWVQDYPKMADKHFDADGRPPQHTFFYPEEEYREEHLSKLSDLCHRGYGEIEIHLHHDDDTEESLTQTLLEFKETLHLAHGALPRNRETGAIQYAFIHGNWALDNSLPDGSRCGVDNELSVLIETGCYCDMTLPSAPSPAQTRKVNSIYYAKGRVGCSKSHDTGVDCKVGGREDGLMLIQGPLGISFKWRNKYGLPHIENGDVRRVMPPIKTRVDQWVKTHIHVKGRPDWIFVKVHTHGTQEADIDTLLGIERDKMHTYLEEQYNDGAEYVLHYVSAREMFNIAKAAESGKCGNPNDYRDFLLEKPSFKPL